MFDRLLTGLVAVSMAFLVWLYARSRDQEMLDNITVPVQITLAPGQSENYDLELNDPAQVAVSFTGPPSRIREVRNLLQRGELRVDYPLVVPSERLEDRRYSDTVRIESGDLHPPPGVTPVVIEGRNRIRVTLRRLVDRRLQVRFEPIGGPAISRVEIEPASVLVRGPEEVLDRARHLPTQVTDLSSRAMGPTSSQAVTLDGVPLVPELEGRKIHLSPSTVRVRITLQPQQKIYDIAEVPIQFLCPANLPLRPLFRDERAGKISLRLLGPAGEEPPTVVAYIDLGGRKWEAGLYEERLKLHLPKDFQLAQDAPRQVAFQLSPIDGAAKSPASPQGP